MMRDPGDDIGPINDDDAATSAMDDSSVGFGNRPEEFLEDTSSHDDVPSADEQAADDPAAGDVPTSANLPD